MRSSGPLPHAPLKGQFGPQLHGPVTSNRVGHVAEIACCICAKALIRFIELGSIRHAEGLGAKLHVHAFSNRKAAEYRGVQIEEARSAEGSASEITENPLSLRLTEGPPALWYLLSAHRDEITGCHVEPWLTRTDSVQYLERAGQVRHLRIPRRVQNCTASNVQGQSSHHCKDRADLPTAEKHASHARLQEGFPLSKWQLVDHTMHNRMPPVKSQRRIIAANAANVILEPANRAVDCVGSFIHVPKGLAVSIGRGHQEAA